MFFFGFDRRVKGLRKKWCKLRIKALKLENYQKTQLLDRLDSIEQDLRTIEEQDLRRHDRNRIADSVDQELRYIEDIIKGRKSEGEIESGKYE